MFVGRDAELRALESHYDTGRFEMVVLYGRRRLGKTMLLMEFSKGKRCLFFTAQEKSDGLNLRGFSRRVFEFFGLGEDSPTFESWGDAFSFFSRQIKGIGGPAVLVFDEFPYAAKANRSLPSTLQVAIDHDLLGTNLTVVLCGSNQGFMEEEVLGSKSPLYGRRTAQIKLLPFDCFTARLMMPDVLPEDAVRYYGTFGGTPYYLAQIDGGRSYEENVKALFFSPFGILYDEPEMLLRQELNEPALYTSILDAIAAGATKPSEIADKAAVAQNSVGKYLKTLEGLGIVRREVPFGDNPRKSRRGIYRLSDPFFAYWYRFVSPNTAAVESGLGGTLADQIAFGDRLDSYLGGQFEAICAQWTMRESGAGRLGFLATNFGKWWGTDPTAKEQADIDIVASDAPGEHLLLGECKWRESFDESEAMRALERRGNIISNGREPEYYLFTKHPVSAASKRKMGERGNWHAVCVDDMGW